jgi:uncharacterized protein
MNPTTTHTFYVTGTHCSSCAHLIEDVLSHEAGVEKVHVSLADETVTVQSTTQEGPATLASRYSGLLAENGYTLYIEKPMKRSNPQEWLYAGTFTALAILGFILLERAGLTSLIGTSEATLTTAFLVGLVASISTCLAVVGGLVLSVSATYAHENQSVKPQVFFHVGRFVTFFVLGGLLGTLGEVVQLGFYGSVLLGAVASVIMLILGVHLLDLTKKVRLVTLPKYVSATLTNYAHKAGKFTPLLLGVVTFFLPCGFTQSMQVVALSSGSFVTGALTMFVFALGTFPVLALLSFGSLDLAKSRYRGVFFKTAGLLVILFALWNMQNVLVVFGVITPIIYF